MIINSGIRILHRREVKSWCRRSLERDAGGLTRGARWQAKRWECDTQIAGNLEQLLLLEQNPPRHIVLEALIKGVTFETEP